MSSTRHASDDSPFRQERYMSDPEMSRGLGANMVAARVKSVPDPEHRKLIWWLQKVSWQPGGIEAIAEQMMQLWPERFATRGMMELGFEEGRIYDAAEVVRIRREINDLADGEFLLSGESTFRDCCERDAAQERVFRLYGEEGEEAECERQMSAVSAVESRVSQYPQNYPAMTFQERCRKTAKRELERFLFERLCLDPKVKMDGAPLWYFPRLVESLAEFYDTRAMEAAQRAPVTEIGEKVEAALDYALEERCFVVVDGVARIGKTFSVKAWCEAHAGQARYVQVPSSNDDMSFFRAICEALGLGSARSYKALELRGKIEDTLQGGDLLLVLDEGHYLWPVRNQRRATPHRINWLLTQLVNFKVPVAVVTTPQFTKSQAAIESGTGWSSEQLDGRIYHYEQLPEKLSKEDLGAVAGYWLPNGDEESINTLIDYADGSRKYLQGIESLVSRARLLARRCGRSEPTHDDVKAALRDGVIPSDNAHAVALSAARSGGRRRAPATVPATPLKAPCAPHARAMHAPGTIPAKRPSDSNFAPIAPSRDAGGAVLST
jgi:hypothetical protein